MHSDSTLTQGQGASESPSVVLCDQCGSPAAGRFTRDVPALNGRPGRVCLGCADEIDALAVLWLVGVDRAVRAGCDYARREALAA